MEQIELQCTWDYLQVRDNLLQTIRIREADPAVRRIGYLRIPREIVANSQIREELERSFPSLVLF